MATKEWKDANQERLRQYRRDWYSRNKRHAIDRVAKRRNEIRQWFVAYKKNLKCARCPESHPACLTFHHRDPAKKDIALSLVAQHGWSIKRIEQELAKCEVLCSNCHQKEHFAYLFE